MPIYKPELTGEADMKKFYTREDHEKGLCDADGNPTKEEEKVVDEKEEVQETTESESHEQQTGTDASGQPNPPDPGKEGE